MKNTFRAAATSSFLTVIDLQERLLPVIPNRTAIIESVQFLLKAAQILGVPGAISEQYPSGLGRTIQPVREFASSFDVFEKLQFSAAFGIADTIQKVALALPISNTVDGEAQDHLAAIKRGQVVICGIETHVCVSQTALELLEDGSQVFVVADAVGSRNNFDNEIALRRLADAGCIVNSSEGIVFEWCERAGTDAFKAISQLVKDRDKLRGTNQRSVSR